MFLHCNVPTLPKPRHKRGELDASNLIKGNMDTNEATTVKHSNIHAVELNVCWPFTESLIKNKEA